MKKTILSSLALVTSMSCASAAVWVADTTFEHATATDTIAATLDGAAVSFTADAAAAFKTGGTNTELTRIDENQAGNLINYTFSSTTGFNDLTLLVHNVLNDTPDVAGANSIGNFTITYANGSTAVADFSTLGSIANIGSTSEFDIENGIDGEPNGLAAAFDDSNQLVATNDATIYDAGMLGATAGTYLYSSSANNPQGSALISFGDSSANGGITGLSFTFVGNTTGGNTAFIGFSGTAVPEPSSTALLGLGGLALLARRRR